MKNSDKLFHFSLGGYYLFYFALVGVYVIFLPKALIQLHYTPTEVGIIYSAAPFMRFLLPFIFKYFIKLNITIYHSSLILSFISSLIFLYTIDSFYLFFISNLLFGASMGISLPYIETIALSQVHKSKYGKIRLWGSIGFMAIALYLGKILDTPYDTLYYLLSMALLTMILGMIVVRYDTNKVEKNTNKTENFSLSKYWLFWVSVFLMQVGFAGFYNFFTIYETQHSISLEMTSWMWSFGVIAEIIMLYFQGPLLQKNLLTIIKISIIITSFRWLILYLYPDSIILTFFAQSLHAFSFALYHTASINYVFTIYQEKKLAQQFFLGIAFGLGGSVGALLAGKIYGDNMFLIESIITLIAFIFLHLHQYRKAKK